MTFEESIAVNSKGLMVKKKAVYPKGLFRNFTKGCITQNASTVLFKRSFDVSVESSMSASTSQLLNFKYSAAGLFFSNPCGTLVSRTSSSIYNSLYSVLNFFALRIFVNSSKQ